MRDFASGHTAEEYQSKYHVWALMACLICGMLMTVLTSTIANVSLPHIQGSLSASREQAVWVISSYVIAATIATPTVGWLAARYGRKALLLASLIGFTVASMLCGAASSIEQLILFRLLQGAFGAPILPLTMAIRVDLYSLERMTNVMFLWGIGMMLGPIMGPTLGGIITDAYSWRWIFYVHLPFGIISILGVLILFKETRKDSRLRFDWIGFGGLAIGLLAMQLALERGNQLQWFESFEVILEAIIACLGFYIFLVRMITIDQPFVPSKLFVDRNYMSAMMMFFIINAVLLASLTLLPPLLQAQMGYPVYETGFIMTPRGIALLVGIQLGARLSKRSDPRIWLTLGTILVLWALWDFAQVRPHSEISLVIFASIIQGIGTGLLVAGMSLIAFSTLPRTFRTDATAFLNLSKGIGSVVGLAITGMIFADSVQMSTSSLTAYINPMNQAVGETQLTAIHAMIARQSQAIAYQNTFMLMFLVSLITLAFIWILKRPPPPSTKDKQDAVVEAA